jgi:uncharacterized protein YqkB
MTEKIVDYAAPLIAIEFMQRVIHDACLKHDYENARKITLELATEARLLAHTLSLMEEEQKKREHGRV